MHKTKFPLLVKAMFEIGRSKRLKSVESPGGRVQNTPKIRNWESNRFRMTNKGHWVDKPNVGCLLDNGDHGFAFFNEQGGSLSDPKEKKLNLSEAGLENSSAADTRGYWELGILDTASPNKKPKLERVFDAFSCGTTGYSDDLSWTDVSTEEEDLPGLNERNTTKESRDAKNEGGQKCMKVLMKKPNGEKIDASVTAKEGPAPVDTKTSDSSEKKISDRLGKKVSNGCIKEISDGSKKKASKRTNRSKKKVSKRKVLVTSRKKVSVRSKKKVTFWDEMEGGEETKEARKSLTVLFPVAPPQGSALLEPASAINVNRSHGETLDRVILALSHNRSRNCKVVQNIDTIDVQEKNINDLSLVQEGKPNIAEFDPDIFFADDSSSTSVTAEEEDITGSEEEKFEFDTDFFFADDLSSTDVTDDLGSTGDLISTGAARTEEGDSREAATTLVSSPIAEQQGITITRGQHSGSCRTRANRFQEERHRHLDNIRVTDFEMTAVELESKLKDCSRAEQNKQNRVARNGSDEGSDDDGSGEDNETGACVGASFFDDQVKCPLKALLLFYTNSGLFRFDEYKEFGSQWDGHEISKEKIIKEIRREKPSEREATRLIKRFMEKHSFVTGDLISCGACGIRLLETSGGVKFNSYSLNHRIMQCLAYTEEEIDSLKKAITGTGADTTIPIDEEWNTRTVALWKARSVYQMNAPHGSESTFWHLHPELVDEDEACPSVRLCPVCETDMKKEKRPKHSIASGVDFGSYERIGLTCPNLFEQMILSRSRLFFMAVKVTSNVRGVVNSDIMHSFKCHSIIFPHDSPDVASYMYESFLTGKDGILDEQSLKSLMQIFFMDSEGNRDRLFQEVYGTNALQARPWVVAQWLIALKGLNPFYADIKTDPIHTAVNVDSMKNIISVIDDVNQFVQENMNTITDEESIRFEERLGSDVAGGSHEENLSRTDRERRDGPSTVGGDNSGTGITFSYVTNTEGAYLAGDKGDFRHRALTRFADLGDKELDTVSPRRITDLVFDSREVDAYLARFPQMAENNMSYRESTPMCDFELKDQGLVTSFPHVFLLGKAYGKCPGRLGHDTRYHLLNQFSTIPCKDRRLLGYLFDIMQRIRIMDGVKTYVDGNQRSVRCIQSLLQSRTERRALRDAIQFPYSSESKSVLEKYMIHMKFAAKDVSYGAVEGQKFKHLAVGTCKRYTAATTLLTLSPANLSDPRSLRLTFRTTSNRRFPSVFHEGCLHGRDGIEFMKQMKDNVRVDEGMISFPRALRAQRSMQNPVAYVIENKRLLCDVMSILFGIEPEHAGFFSKMQGTSRRRTRYYRSSKGIFGHPLSISGVGETHQKGYIHWHFNIIGGLSSYVLERFANIQDICDEVSQVLNSIYTTALPPSHHVASMVRKVLKKKRDLWQICDGVVDSIAAPDVMISRAGIFGRMATTTSAEPYSEIHADTICQGSIHNIHTHGETCKKGLWGKTGCRLNQPQGCVELTRPVKLVSTDRVTLGPGVESGVGPSVGPGAGQGTSAAIQFLQQEDREAEESVTYSIESLGNALGIHEESVYHLRNVVGKAGLGKSMVIWETMRPIINCADLLLDAEEMTDIRKDVLQALHSVLEDAPSLIFPSNGLFWHWLEDIATEDQLVELYQHIKEMLPKANGYVAAFNTTLAFCTSSHNNVCLLGGAGQAKAALFYLIPYESKRKFPLEQTLTILQDTLTHVQNYPSIANDSGTVPRTVKHYLTRVLNQMHLKMEISDWEVAAALLDMPSVITTDRFAYVSPLNVASLRTRIQMEEDDQIAQEAIFDEIQEQQEARGNDDDNWIDNSDSIDSLDTESFQENNEARQDDEQENGLDEDPPPYHHESVIQSLGYICKMQINIKGDASNPPRVLLMPITMQYWYRGEPLHKLNLYEYIAVIQFKNSKPSEATDNPINFRQQTQFRMADVFVGYHDGYHVIKAKHSTPLEIGKKPRHPGGPPAMLDVNGTITAVYKGWKEQADKFARYYLAYFRPDYPGAIQEYDWQALQNWVRQCQDSASIIDKFRLMTMHNHITGLYCSSSNRTMAKDYRARARDKWTLEELADDARQAAYAQRMTRLDFARQSRLLHREVDASSINNAMKQINHVREEQRVLESCSHCPAVNAHGEMDKGVVAYFDTKTVQRHVSEMKEWKASGSQDSGRFTNIWTRQDRDIAIKKIRDTLDTDPNNRETQQLEIFDMYVEHFTGTRPLPQIVLLHGGPGVGKTTVRDAILDVAEICGRYLLRVAFNAINAVEMGGDTISSVAAIKAGEHMTKLGKFEASAIQNVLGKGLSKNSVLAEEEISTMAPWHDARLHHFLQIALNSNDLYGGIQTVLKTGDLGQLGPVKAGSSLTQAIMDIYLAPDLRKSCSKQKSKRKGKVKTDNSVLPAERKEDAKYSATHPYMIGTRLLTEARLFELTEQKRSLDPGHTEMIDKLYNRKPISFQDLKEREYEMFCEKDNLDEDWVSASVLTITNRQRYTLTDTRARIYAKFHGLPVIRWFCNYDHWVNKPPESCVNEALKDPLFYEYHVPGAKGFFTERYMKELRLINGIPFRYHALLLESEEQKLMVQEYIDRNKPGDVITLPFTPLAQLVEVFPPANTPSDVIEALKRFSKPYDEERQDHGPVKLIIPVSRMSCKWSDKPVVVYGGPGFPPSWVKVSTNFPLEPAFAITVNKSQGKTLDRVILALSYNRSRNCNFDYKRLHVAFSRVRHRKHIRLLLVGGGGMQWNSLLYLSRLRPDPSIQYFFDGFRDVTGDNPNEDWVNNKWNAEKANQQYRQKLESSS